MLGAETRGRALAREGRVGVGLRAPLRVLPLALVAIVASSAAAPPATHNAAVRATSADETSIVVRARRAEDLERLAAHATSLGYEISQRSEQIAALHLSPPAGVDVETALAAFAGQSGVLFAEPAYRVEKADTPSDPLYATRQARYLNPINAPAAWDIEKGEASVVVAVIDTGIDLNHVDLEGRLWRNPGEWPNNNRDDDGNGCIDDLNGCAFVTSPAPGCQRAQQGFVHDDIGHGTFVAGIIAANGNNSGMVGVARGVSIMAVKVLDCAGTGETFALAEGIRYAARNGAHVINISLGGRQDAAIIREAVREARNTYGATIVAASGNSGTEGVSYPARYPEVIAVGAASIANPDIRAKFSTSGPEVDVVAVGERIVGTVPQSSCNVFLICIDPAGYAVGDGTSFSAPQVSALAALILSRTAGLRPDAVEAAIKSTAKELPPGTRPNWAGEGRIDMLAALRVRTGYVIGIPGASRN
jgi:subtilisin family serine protease